MSKKLTIIKTAGVYSLSSLSRSSRTNLTPYQKAIDILAKKRNLMIPSPSPDQKPFRRTASLALIKRLLYRSISTFSPPKANTVRIPLKTSSTTLAAAEEEFVSFVVSDAWSYKYKQ